MSIITTTKEMRPRDPHDFYPTPISTVEAALNTLPVRYQPTYILDPGAGDGVWGKVAAKRWPEAFIKGVELRGVHRPPEYAVWLQHDFRLHQEPIGYDLIMGNPPYKHAEAFIRVAFNHLRPEGRIVFLLRLAFLEGQARRQGLWRDYPPSMVCVCSSRPSFTGNGKTDATAYAIFSWLKGWEGTTMLGWVA